MKISACVPCFNNAATLIAAVDSVRHQTRPVDELFVVDDGSTDGSADLVESHGIRVIRLGRNCGRGAARARALSEATGKLILFCDATAFLPADFLERALPPFQAPQLAALFGACAQPPAQTVVERWRGRHLFKIDLPETLQHHAPLMTHGTLLRVDTVMQLGNFNPQLRHSEDAELGARLLAAGFDVIQDRSLKVMSLGKNSLLEVLERYWRWHAGPEESVSLSSYVKQISYSIKVMARCDLKAGDPLSVPISLLSPHYQFWKTRLKAEG